MGEDDKISILGLILTVVCLALAIVILVKIKKHCSSDSKQGYQKTKAAPPSAGQPTHWATSDGQAMCEQAFDAAGCSTDECCDCGPMGMGPKFMCGDTFMNTFEDLGNPDPSCPVGTPVAFNKAMCAAPVTAGPMLCGGAVPNDCQDVGLVCVEKPDMPFGAKGMCGRK